MRTLSGSYTIEATFVMSVILLSMAALIRFGYLQCRQTTGNMRLHEMVEIMRYQEGEKENERTLVSSAYRIRTKRYGNRVEGGIEGDGWNLTIESQIFKPEEFIRMLTLAPEKDQGEVEVE